MSPLVCVIHKVILYNLLPRYGGGADFTFQDMILTIVILRGLPFNFAQIMLQHMVSYIC